MSEPRPVEPGPEKAPDAFRTISEVAQDLDLPQHVLRFWETRFTQIKPLKRGGGRRYYRPEDVELLKGIRYYLYGEGYTIKGVQRILKERGLKHVIELGRAQSPGYLPPVAKAGAQRRVEAFDDFPEPAPPSTRATPPPDPVVPLRPREPETVRLPVARPLAEPPRLVATTSTPAPSTQPMRASVGRDDIRRLQAALFELAECRRILDAVRLDHRRS